MEVGVHDLGDHLLLGQLREWSQPGHPSAVKGGDPVGQPENLCCVRGVDNHQHPAVCEFAELGVDLGAGTDVDTPPGGFLDQQDARVDAMPLAERDLLLVAPLRSPVAEPIRLLSIANRAAA